MKSKSNNTIIAFTFCLLAPLFTYSCYKSIASILKLKILGSLIWSSIFFISIRLITGIRYNLAYIITSINILEDGQYIEVVTSVDKFKVDIAHIRRCTSDEAMTVYTNMKGSNDYVPIMINQQNFLIPYDSEITNKNVFNAISDGSYIRVKSKEKNETIIDI